MSFQTRRKLSSRSTWSSPSCPRSLKSEGFGVLTEIDIQDTLKQRLGVSFRRHKIFGACNAPLAHQALQAELEVGLMLPAM